MSRITTEEYLEKRRELVEKNSNLVGVVLRENERKLNERLTALKQAFVQSCDSVPYDMPVLRDERIHGSALYDFCRRLPKGADLHVHGTALLPAHRLLDFACGQEKLLLGMEDFCLHMQGSDTAQKCVPLKTALESGMVTREELLKKWTVLGVKEGQNIWEYFEGLFAVTSAIDKDSDVLYAYYLEAFRYYVRSGIFHVEIHLLMATDEERSLRIVETIRSAYYAVRKEYPYFIVSVIGSGAKNMALSVEDAGKRFRNTLLAQKALPDEFEPESVHPFVLGFDLVNEEDTGRPLRDYAPMLMGFREEYPDFEYFLHCGESLNAESDNLIDAYLIEAKRVGHGMNLYRYPNLLKAYADREICLEVCLISNQSLRYTLDLRLHPGMEYLKRGVTVALCSDDPVFLENETLTDDFFAAITCWNLGVAEIKQLCINSILYSGVDQQTKRKLLGHWNEAWKRFVAELSE